MSQTIWISASGEEGGRHSVPADALICPSPTPDQLQGASLLLFPAADWERLRRWRVAGHRAVAVVCADDPPEEGRAALEPLLLVRAFTPDVLEQARQTGAPFGRLTLGPVTVDLLRRTVLAGEAREPGEPAREAGRLSALEADLLAYLAARSDRDVSREELQLQVWGHRKVLATRAVDMAVSRLRRKIEPQEQDIGPDEPDSEPRFLLTRRGGYRLLLGAPAPPAPAPAPATPRSAPLPAPGRLSALIGREALMRELLVEVAQSRLVTLLGPPGVGKTRLALELVAQAAPLHLRHLWFCDLTAATTVGAMISQVSATTGQAIAGADTRELAERLGSALSAAGPGLLILDNAEQLVDACAPVWSLWIDAAPEVRFLVTSQIRLHLRAERVCEIPVLPPDDAAALFRARARAIGQRGFEPDDPDTPQAARAGIDREIRAIVAALDGLPLAIELAASRTRLLSLPDLQRQLQHRFRLLQDRATDRPERHRTLRAALQWSWELLTPAHRQHLSRLSVFLTPFDLERAEAVLGGTALSDLEELLDRSLLQREGSRYRMLSSIRAMIAENAPCPPDCLPTHAAFFARQAPRWMDMLIGSGSPAAQQEIAACEADLDAAWRQTDSPADCLDIAEILEAFYACQGAWDQRAALLPRTIGMGAAEPPILLARALLLRAQIMSTETPALAASDLQRAIDLLAEHPRFLALARLQQALYSRAHARNTESLQQARLAAAAALQAGDAPLLAHARCLVILLCQITGGSDPDACPDAAYVAGIERNIGVLLRHDHLLPAFNSLSWLALLTRNTGDLTRSLAARRQALAVARQLTRKRALGHASFNLAFALVWQHEYAAALHELDEATRVLSQCLPESGWRIRAAFRGSILAHADRLGEAEAALLDGYHFSLSSAQTEETAQFLRLLCVVATLRRRPDAALQYALLGHPHALAAAHRLLQTELLLQQSLALALLHRPDEARAASDAITALPPGETAAQIHLLRLRLAADPEERAAICDRLEKTLDTSFFPGDSEIREALPVLRETGRLPDRGRLLSWFRQFTV